MIVIISIINVQPMINYVLIDLETHAQNTAIKDQL